MSKVKPRALPGTGFLWILLFLSLGRAQVREPLPMPDVMGYRTLKCDFHMHTVFSDGNVWPSTRLTDAWRDGLDAIAITDHSDYNPHKDDLKPDSARAHDLIRPLAERYGIILIPAVEVAEGDQHFNLLFVKDANAFKGALLLDALRRAQSQGAFAFWNHPGWKRPAEWWPLIASAYDQKLFQGMELVNGNSFYPEAYPWIESKNLTILADSDVHDPMPAARNGNIRPMTLVFSRSADAAGIREALEERRTAAWMGREIWGAETFLKGLWEGSVKPENSSLRLHPADPGALLRLRNLTAQDFKFRIVRMPSWLGFSGGGNLLPGQTLLACNVRATRDAPAGLQKVEIEMELTNLHIGPGKNLVVSLPLTIDIQP